MGLGRYVAMPAVCCALAVAGCGGSSSSSGTLTHAQLVSKVNAICAQRNTKIAALPKAFANPSSLRQLATYLGDLEAINVPLLNQLYALKPPASDTATWNDAVKDNRQITQLIAQAKTSAQAGNVAEVRKIEIELQPINASLRSDAGKLGLTECLKQPLPSG